MVLGVIFDTVGRKIPTVLGFVTAALAILGTPWFTVVYPWFLLMRVMISVGIIPGLNTPLLPDYVDKKSLGLANAYVILKSLLFIAKLGKCDIFDHRNNSIVKDIVENFEQVDFHRVWRVYFDDCSIDDVGH